MQGKLSKFDMKQNNWSCYCMAAGEQKDKDFKFFSLRSRSRIFLRVHYEAKLCILCIVSGFGNKDAPFVLLLFFTFL